KTSLADAFYQWRFDTSKITDLAGNTLAGTSAFSFFRLQGDATGDGVVDASTAASSDMTLVNAALGTRPGYAKWNANADLDRDLLVSTSDRLIVSNNKGHVIIRPSSLGGDVVGPSELPPAAPPDRVNAEVDGDVGNVPADA